MVVWAADIGGTNIRLAIVRRNKIVARTVIPAMAHLGLRAALKRMVGVWTQLHADPRITTEKISAIGLAIPGIVNPQTGQIYPMPKGKFADAPRLFAGPLLQKILPVAPFWCNDAHAALAGEHRFGAAKGAKNVVLITLGTGIGTAVMLDGRPLFGAHGMAGNVGGHTTIDIRGAACLCGNIGCAETRASTWMLPELAQGISGFNGSSLASLPLIDFENLFAHAAAGDAAAQKILNQCLHTWAVLVCNLIHQYDPELVLLGGGIGSQHKAIFPFIWRFAKQHSWAKWPLDIRPAMLGPDAGLIGIAHLAALNRGRVR